MDEAFLQLAAPARRALSGLGVTKVEDLTKFRENEIMALHGMGPSAMKHLRNKLALKGLAFAEDSINQNREKDHKK